jgi:hypothetical protein
VDIVAKRKIPAFVRNLIPIIQLITRLCTDRAAILSYITQFYMK